jgi:hypothetical protein
MSKSRIAFIVLMIVGGLAAVGYTAYNNRYLYDAQETAYFKIKVGDEFKVRLYQNASKAFGNCRLDKRPEDPVRLVSMSYEPDWLAGLLNGEGGKNTLVFKGVKSGQDTIRISNCETIETAEGCECRPGQQLRVDNVFVVTVTP